MTDEVLYKMQELDEQADKVIAGWSLAALGANIAPPPFDMALVGTVFARMGKRLASVYGVQLSRSMLKSLGLAIGQGIGGVLAASYIGTGLFKYVPGVNLWVALLVQPPIVGAVTFASGHAFKQYYRTYLLEGRSLTPMEVQELAKNALREKLEALRGGSRPQASVHREQLALKQPIETQPYAERQMIVVVGGSGNQKGAPGQFLRVGSNLSPIRFVAHEEVKNVTFPVGHPLNNFVYVGHPLVPTRYYLAADFHNSVFAHKVAEVSRMLRYLGASHIKVERRAGYTANASINAKLGALGQDVKGDAGYDRTSSKSIVYESHFRPVASPQLPADMVWYAHEDMWKEVAEGRLHHGTQNFQLDVEYKDDFGVNAGLERSIEALKIKLELGGKFTGHKDTIWHISGEFGETENTQSYLSNS